VKIVGFSAAVEAAYLASAAGLPRKVPPRPREAYILGTGHQWKSKGQGDVADQQASWYRSMQLLHHEEGKPAALSLL
jgi:hypothetical protein